MTPDGHHITSQILESNWTASPFLISYPTLIFTQYLATAKNQTSQEYDVIERDLAPSNVEK